MGGQIFFSFRPTSPVSVIMHALRTNSTHSLKLFLLPFGTSPLAQALNSSFFPSPWNFQHRHNLSTSFLSLVAALFFITGHGRFVHTRVFMFKTLVIPRFSSRVRREREVTMSTKSQATSGLFSLGIALLSLSSWVRISFSLFSFQMRFCSAKRFVLLLSRRALG